MNASKGSKGPAVFLAFLLLGGLLLAAGPTPPAGATTLREVLARGTLRVGVKVDYPPYGMVHRRELVGLEPDLARDLAKLLGVELEMKEVSANDRFERLLRGEVDVLIATVSDTEERRRAVRIVDPSYYSSGTNLLAQRTAGFGSWEDLNRIPVCAVGGAFYNDRTALEFGAELMEFDTPTEMLQGLDGGLCLAAVYDAAFLSAQLATGEWPEYEIPLQTIDIEYWGIVVHPDAPALAALVSGAIVGWHIHGRLKELEEEYELRPNDFVEAMYTQFRTINPSIGRGRRR